MGEAPVITPDRSFTASLGTLAKGGEKRVKPTVDEKVKEAAGFTKRREEITKLATAAKEKNKLPEGKEKAFEDAFSQKIRVTAEGGDFDAVAIKPENAVTEVPVLLAPGMGASMDVNKEMMKQVYGKGREVLSLEHARVGGKLSEVANYPKEAARKAQALIKLVETQGEKKTDIIAHSEGGLYVAVAAAMRPDLFRNIVFVDPAGMIRGDTMKALMDRQGEETAQKKALAKIDTDAAVVNKKADKAFTSYFMKNPLRALQEVHEMSATQVHEVLQGLREQGMGIAVVHGVDDKVFPMDSVQNTLTSDQLDGFYSLNATHNDIQFHPELFMVAVNHAIEEMEQKSIKKAESTARDIHDSVKNSQDTKPSTRHDVMGSFAEEKELVPAAA